MEYKEIGKRLASERRKLGLSQSALADTIRARVPVGRNTLSGLETGKEIAWRNVSLELLLCLCDLFSCDLGYLMGMYPEHTINAKLAREYTGLTEQAVNNLHAIVGMSNRESESLILFLESEFFFDFVSSISNCYRHYENMAYIKSAMEIDISANSDMEKYRQQSNAIQTDQYHKNGKDAASFTVNRASIRIADYMIMKSKERWGNNGEKEHS